MPTERPPAASQPRAAASITPPRPPQTRTPPASAISRPTSSAPASSGSLAPPDPHTATWGAVILAASAPGPAEHRGKEGDGPRLVERLVAVAALRRLHAGRAPVGTGALADRLQRGLQEHCGGTEPAFGDPRAARVPVVDEDRTGAGVGMERGRHAADVPSVARRDERQQPDRGVLGGMGRPREVRV